MSVHGDVSATGAPILVVEHLSTTIELRKSVVHAVSDVGMYLNRGETLGLVGESGCGKSMTGLSIMGLLPAGGRVSQGSITLAGRELVGLADSEYRRVRGNEISMVFQDSMTALDPTKTIGYQVAEPLRVHRGMGRRQALERATEMLALVGLPRPVERLDSYPHQLSGGLRQRVMIAMALVCEPKVLIADEPTTALDVTTQAQILRLLDELKTRLGMAMILVTHDMGVIAEWADRVQVMYAGQLIETAPTGQLFTGMRHPYTQALLAAIPELEQNPDDALYSIPGLPPDLTRPPVGCRFAARCAYATDQCRQREPPTSTDRPGHTYACWHPVSGPLASAPGSDAPGHQPARRERVDAVAAGGNLILEVRDLVKEYPVGRQLSRASGRGTVKAVSGVSFEIEQGHTFGLVGESGCGKSTLGRMIVALDAPSGGTIDSDGVDLAGLRGRRLRAHRRDAQMVFQDPFDSLDPRMRIAASLAEPLRIQGIGTRRERDARIRELLDEVGLPRDALERYPHEFSGGQRQRIGLARALALNPHLIVADEPVSALDVSIQSQILNLMKRIQAEHNLTYLVISHDLTVVRYLADRIGVMYLGKMVEIGPADEVYRRPAHPYTAGLLAAIPMPRPGGSPPAGRIEIAGELPSAIDPPSGCRFRTRCPFAQPRCADEEPGLRSFGAGHVAACHFPLHEPGLTGR